MQLSTGIRKFDDVFKSPPSAHAELVEASFLLAAAGAKQRGPFDELRVSGIQYVIVIAVGST
jgi:hypothetical protein